MMRDEDREVLERINEEFAKQQDRANKLAEARAMPFIVQDDRGGIIFAAVKVPDGILTVGNGLLTHEHFDRFKDWLGEATP
jgi:hypothetical protein